MQKQQYVIADLSTKQYLNPKQLLTSDLSKASVWPVNHKKYADKMLKKLKKDSSEYWRDRAKKLVVVSFDKAEKSSNQQASPSKSTPTEEVHNSTTPVRSSSPLNEFEVHEAMLDDTSEIIDATADLMDVANRYGKIAKVSVILKRSLALNLKKYEEATQDILHVIELSDFDSKKGCQLASKLKEIRQERRICKDRLQILETLFPTGTEDIFEDAANATFAKMAEQKDRNYTYRNKKLGEELDEIINAPEIKRAISDDSDHNFYDSSFALNTASSVDDVKPGVHNAETAGQHTTDFDTVDREEMVHDNLQKRLVSLEDGDAERSDDGEPWVMSDQLRQNIAKYSDIDYLFNNDLYWINKIPYSDLSEGAKRILSNRSHLDEDDEVAKNAKSLVQQLSEQNASFKNGFGGVYTINDYRWPTPSASTDTNHSQPSSNSENKEGLPKEEEETEPAKASESDNEHLDWAFPMWGTTTEENRPLLGCPPPPWLEDDADEANEKR